MIEGLGDETKTIVYNEPELVGKVAATGVRNPHPEAGIRMGGEKYMMKYHDADNKVANLNHKEGGASVGMTGGGALIVGIWKKDQKMSNDKFQNAELCYNLVKEMAAYLTEQGY